ncbi:MAG: lyase [Luteolibacter sp.]
MTLPVRAAGVIHSPSQAAVNAAIAAPLITYRKNFSGGAYTDQAFSGGSSIALAVASYAGNTSADARLLQQIRYTLTPWNEICANGGYPAQHERHVTGMFAIVKQTPRIWNQLSAAEITKIDLIMKACLVSSAFTTANNNPFILAGTQQYSIDGDPNLNRDWNPNYREGMIGGVLVGMAYFGGPTAASAILNGYNHAQFLADLSANNLPNIYQIFNWKAANPTSGAPSGTMIENGVRNYAYHNSPLASYMDIYYSLLTDTYGMSVNAGLNGGAGINGAGKIVSGAATLPNPGALGMLKEFDSADGNGPRSSLIYAYDGFRPHQTNQLVLIICGFWQRGTNIANTAAARMNIGDTDLWYKIEKGYIGYAKGASQGVMDQSFSTGWGFVYTRSLWEDVLKPYHGLVADGDADGDGVSNDTEALLGLDPNNSFSRFSAGLDGGQLNWPSATGLSFIVQRSTGTSDMSWQTIATLPGTAGTASFTDPSPPAGNAFYRVGLNP